MKKLVALLLVLLLAVSVTACAAPQTNAPADDAPSGDAPAAAETPAPTPAPTDDLEPVTLKIVLFGDKKAETDRVFGVIADTFRDELNCDYQVDFIAGTEYSQKLLVKASAGEAWDLNFDGDWVCYYQMVAREAYMDLTELLPAYAPDVYAKYQQNNVLDACYYDGKLVALPWTMNMNNRPWFTWRQDYAEKAGIEINPEDINTFDDVYEVLLKFHEAYPDKQTIRDSSFDTFMVLDNLVHLGHQLYVDLTDPTYTVIPVEETDAYMYYAEWGKKCQDAGLISADVLTDKLDGNALLNNGQLTCRFGTHEFAYSVRAMVEEDAEWQSHDLYTDHYFANRTPLANIVCIPDSAENPERALMMLNMVETNQEYFDMLQYGIEGETYVLGENGEANYPDGMNAANSNYMDWGGRWAFWKPQFMRPNFEYPEGFWTREAEYAAQYDTNVVSPLNGFAMNVDEISIEIAQRDQIHDDANKLIAAGLAGDPAAAVEKLNADQEAAGRAKILEVVQAQVDEFMGK